MDERWQTHRIYVEPTTPADDLLEREWTLTNGTGAYAMGTVAGCNTRRYHGLFVPATRPPVGRIVGLSQMWEQVLLTPAASVADTPQVLDFSTLAFRAMHDGSRTMAPRGHEMIQQFDRGLSVAWSYRWGAIEFERELFLHWKQQAITLRYRVRGLEEAGLAARLRLHPMVALRDYHGLRNRDGSRFEVTDARGEFLTVTDAYFPEHALTFTSSHGAFTPHDGWWDRVWYPAESERGQDDAEDYHVPARLTTEVAEGAVVAVTVALGNEPVEPVIDAADRAGHLEAIVRRLDATLGAGGRPAAPRHTTLTSCLAIAADDFVADRTIRGERLSTIIAGYPWFSDWGRDTFIALPGLLLCTGRFAEARDTLRAFADAIFDGLVPNRFDDYNDAAAHYNTVDASLWFIQAALQYLATTGDNDAWREWLAAACLRIVDAYAAGTQYGIVMDTDGLITAGDATTQLTWMDAATNGVVFTPRFGKAVEINALWYNALAGLADALPKDAPDHRSLVEASETCAKLAERVKRAFGKVFWSDEHGYLVDTVWRDADGAVQRDASIRPNQVFAISLPQSPLPATKQKQVLATLRDHLLTPVGLRTLPPADPRYHGRYTGPQFHRDEAYHQGTIWPWLIGPYAEAILRIGRFSKRAKQEARAVLSPLIHQLTGDEPPVSLGQLHEIYEADPLLGRAGHPAGGHRPVGAIAQAWSVAELIRALYLAERG